MFWIDTNKCEESYHFVNKDKVVVHADDTACEEAEFDEGEDDEDRD